MSRWARINLILASTATGLFLLAMWPKPEQVATTLTELSPTQIGSIRVERNDRLVLALARDDRGWQLTHPFAATATDSRVNRLLAITRAPVHHRFPLSGQAARFGLDKPKAILRLEDQVFRFGDRDPVDEARYVQIGNEVAVVDDLYFNLLTLPASHFKAAAQTAR